MRLAALLAPEPRRTRYLVLMCRRGAVLLLLLHLLHLLLLAGQPVLDGNQRGPRVGAGLGVGFPHRPLAYPLSPHPRRSLLFVTPNRYSTSLNPITLIRTSLQPAMRRRSSKALQKRPVTPGSGLAGSELPTKNLQPNSAKMHALL